MKNVTKLYSLKRSKNRKLSKQTVNCEMVLICNKIAIVFRQP